MLLDGYPRSLSQMEMMLDICHRYQRDMLAIRFVLPESVAIERMKARGRTDDADASIQKRIKQYHEVTEPMIQRFQQVMPVIDIDASPDIPHVHEAVMRVVSG